jgi:hypothetical protein
MLTFVDAGILILGARGQGALSDRALAVLCDPRRRFVASPFLRLEVASVGSTAGRAGGEAVKCGMTRGATDARRVW